MLIAKCQWVTDWCPRGNIYCTKCSRVYDTVILRKVLLAPVALALHVGRTRNQTALGL